MSLTACTLLMKPLNGSGEIRWSKGVAGRRRWGADGRNTQIGDHQVSQCWVFFCLRAGQKGTFQRQLQSENRWTEYARRARDRENSHFIAIDRLAFLMFLFILEPLKIN